MFYRVIINVSYHTAFFDFDNMADASVFASTAAAHAVGGSEEDDNDNVKVSIVFIKKQNKPVENPTAEDFDKNDDEEDK